jgi:DNA-binding protein HU-beta
VKKKTLFKSACFSAHFLKFLLQKNRKNSILRSCRWDSPLTPYKETTEMAKKELIPTTKSGIMAALAEAAGISKKQAVAVYDKLVEIAVKGAKQEEKGITLPAIGKVKLVKRPARTCRNPATGEMVKVKAKKVVKLVACKALKDAILPPKA